MSDDPETIAEAKLRYIEDEDGDYWELPLENDIDRLLEESDYPGEPWDDAVTTDPDAIEAEITENDEEEPSWAMPDAPDPGPDLPDPEPDKKPERTEYKEQVADSIGVGDLYREVTHEPDPEPQCEYPTLTVDSHWGDVHEVDITPTAYHTTSGHSVTTTDVAHSGEVVLDPETGLTDHFEELHTDSTPFTLIVDNHHFEQTIVTDFIPRNIEHDTVATVEVCFEAAEMVADTSQKTLHRRDIITEDIVDQLVEETIEHWHKSKIGTPADAISHAELVDEIRNTLDRLNHPHEVRCHDDTYGPPTIEVFIPHLEYRKRFAVAEPMTFDTEPEMASHQ